MSAQSTIPDQLRRIAADIESSKPSKDLVIEDLSFLIASLRVAGGSDAADKILSKIKALINELSGLESTNTVGSAGIFENANVRQTIRLLEKAHRQFQEAIGHRGILGSDQ